MKFTIFTPCFNSSNFIERTYQSLLKQTFTDFEWLVIDDCSSDDTYKLLRSFKKENEVNISLHKNEENLMLARTCNKAVEIARGEFFIFLGHDDELTKNALQRFNEVWESLTITDKNNLVGMMANCVDETGLFVDDQLPEEPIITDYFNIYYNHGIQGEKCFCYLTNKILEENFSTVDKYVPENVMLLNLSDKYDTYFFNENLRIYHREHISFSDEVVRLNSLKYSRGMMHAKQEDLNRRSKKLLDHRILFFKTMLNYLRFSMHSGINFLASLNRINSRLIRFFLIIIVPISFLVFIKDKVLLDSTYSN